MRRKNVTISDIAQRAGTSASTVGAVMNGSWRARRISEARATAIRAIADEMGYAPNMQASALRRAVRIPPCSHVVLGKASGRYPQRATMLHVTPHSRGSDVKMGRVVMVAFRVASSCVLPQEPRHTATSVGSVAASPPIHSNT